MVPAGNGGLWVSDRNGQVSHITPMGSVTTFGIRTGPLTAGPDRNIWCAVTNAGGRQSLLKIEVGGRRTSYPLPVGRYASSIVPGANGTAWIVDNRDGAIGHLDRGGAFTWLRIQSDTLTGQLEAPDDSVYLLGDENHRLVRVTATGVVTRFPRLKPQLGPVILAGNHLWYQRAGGDQVLYRTTLDGVTSRLRLPFAISNPTLGRDGALWAPDARRAVARISATGAVKEYARRPLSERYGYFAVQPRTATTTWAEGDEVVHYAGKFRARVNIYLLRTGR